METVTVQLGRDDIMYWDMEQDLTITDPKAKVQVENTHTVQQAINEGRLKLVQSTPAPAPTPEKTK